MRSTARAAEELISSLFRVQRTQSTRTTHKTARTFKPIQRKIRRPESINKNRSSCMGLLANATGDNRLHKNYRRNKQ